MSDSTPPGPTPSGPPPSGPPPSGPPPSGPPPSGPPPSGPPPSGPPPTGPPAEYLSSTGTPTGPTSRGGSSKKKAILAGGAIVGLAAVGAVAAGAMWYLSSGPQPAEALPDDTLAYVSIDIDPSGKQLLAAKETLEKFPAWQQEDISSKKDLREALFDKIGEESGCDLDYGDDIEPWLGDALGIAAVPGESDDDAPNPVFVVQIKDADKAEDGIETLADCAEGSSESYGYAISGDWAVFAETEEIAARVAEDAKDSPLSGDDDYQRWTGEAGDDGILTAYAAPALGDYVADHPEALDLGDDLPDEITSALSDFQGAAVKVRFADGGLEVEGATDKALGSLSGITGGDEGVDALTTLPADTAAAYGVSFADGWVEDALDYVERFSGEDVSELVGELEDETGLSVPDDIEDFFGDSAVLALGPDVDFGSLEEPSDLPAALKITGDPEATEAVLDKLSEGDLLPDDLPELVETDSEGDHVVIGPDSDYREELLEDGGLGDSDVFTSVVPDADKAAGILYVNFDAGDWLASLADDFGSDELVDNLEPLEAFGVASWIDGDVSHGKLKITTND